MKSARLLVGFLSKLARLSDTGHTHKLNSVLADHGLMVQAPISYVKVGLAKPHPVLRLSNLIGAFSKENKFKAMLLHNHSLDDIRAFWKKYELQYPQHPVFREHAHRLSRCLPMFLHADEGVGLKKRGVLVLQAHAVLGRGSSRNADLNMIANTFLTRILFAVMNVGLYNKQKTVLYNLLDHWAQDLKQCFEEGVLATIDGQQIRVYPVVLGMKGDLQGLVKVGRLTQNFLRDSPLAANPPGICHLCNAGKNGYPWHQTGCNAAWLRDSTPQTPWTTPSPLLQIPCEKSSKFFLLDVFHIMHKGVLGDMAACSLEPRLNICISLIYCILKHNGTYSLIS